jgi:isopentenyl diphosphate isomerase/L-lactate dehydrogenase-like FMN-dependent dehydrogenase
VSGNREYNLRNGFTIPFSYSRKSVTDVLRHPRWLLSVLARYVMTTGMPTYANYPEELKTTITARPMGRSMLKCESLNWEHLRALRKMWPGKLMVKGVLHPDDAKLAADCGADGVIVSNHGGRNLDSSMAPLDMLPEVVDAVGKRMTVIVDGGFRRGSDIVKAMALGAHAVLIGRATLYGVAAAGEAGAVRAIDILREETDRVMALIGCRSVAELGPQYLRFLNPTATRN